MNAVRLINSSNLPVGVTAVYRNGADGFQVLGHLTCPPSRCGRGRLGPRGERLGGDEGRDLGPPEGGQGPGRTTQAVPGGKWRGRGAGQPRGLVPGANASLEYEGNRP